MDKRFDKIKKAKCKALATFEKARKDLVDVSNAIDALRSESHHAISSYEIMIEEEKESIEFFNNEIKTVDKQIENINHILGE